VSAGVAVTKRLSSRIPHRIKLNLQAILGRAYPRVVGANREPSWIFFEAVLPLLGIAAYVFIYQAIGDRAVAAILQATSTAPLRRLMASTTGPFRWARYNDRSTTTSPASV